MAPKPDADEEGSRSAEIVTTLFRDAVTSTLTSVTRTLDAPSAHVTVVSVDRLPRLGRLRSRSAITPAFRTLPVIVRAPPLTLTWVDRNMAFPILTHGASASAAISPRRPPTPRFSSAGDA